MQTFTRTTIAALLTVALGVSLAAPAFAQDKPAAGEPATDAPADPAKPGKKKKKAQPARSLEARHAVCLAFIKRHGQSCDPWVEPTCGADIGYFRPMECVRPRSQQ